MLSAAVKGDHDHATRMAATEEDDVRFFSRAFTYINIHTYIHVGCMRTSFMVALEKSVVIESPPFAYI